MHVYSLTKLTGRRKNLDRTIVVATVEVNRFTFLVVIASVLASLPVTALVALLLGSNALMSLLVPVMFAFAGIYLVDQRTRSGLRLRRYEAMWDRRKAKTTANTVFVCGQPLHDYMLAGVVHPFIDAPAPSNTAAAIGRSVNRSTPKVGVLG